MLSWLKERVLPVLRRTAEEWQEDNGPWLAAGIAYYAAFSVFPLLLVLIAALGVLLRFSPEARGAQQELLLLIALNTSPSVAVQVEQIMAGVKIEAGVSGPIGLLTLLIGAMGVFGALDNAFDRLWGVKHASQGIVASVRNILIKRLSAFLMLLGLGVLMVIAFVGSLVLTAIGARLEHLPGAATGLQVLKLVLGFLIELTVFAVLYKVLPKPFVPWRAAWLGALPAALAWEIGKQVLAAFVIGGNYSAYGVIGAFIALMAWIYYASTVFFFGAELVQVLCCPERKARRLAQQAAQKS